MPARRGNVGDPTTRTAILDAAQELMLADGYAAVTTRRVAARAGVNSALVFYYFESVDGLFTALFERGAARNLERLQRAMASPQPLWGFWDLIHDQSGPAQIVELMALAKHRKAIRAQLAALARDYRTAQVDALTTILERYGVDPERWPPASVIVILSGISQFVLVEETLGLEVGHADAVAMVEGHIRELEGERGSRVSPGKRSARRRSG